MIDPQYAYLENAKGDRFQVLKPQEYGERPMLDAEGHPVPAMDGDDVLLDPDGQPLFMIERYSLPREWDEAATHAAMDEADGRDG